jgi:hypothetical protein
MHNGLIGLFGESVLEVRKAIQLLWSSWHHSCLQESVPKQAKPVLGTSGSKKPAAKISCIRLDDLIPRKNITGGNRLLFGASSNSQTQTKIPGRTKNED